MKRTHALALLVAGLGAGATVIVLAGGGGATPGRPGSPEPAAATALAPAPPAVLSQPLIRTLETKLGRVTFDERRYLPEYALPQLATRPDASWLRSPEAVMASLFSAMQAGDWRWAMSLFDPESMEWQARWEVDKEKFLAAWSAFAGKRWVLVKQHQLPGYAVIYVRRTDRPEGDPNDALPYALRQDDGGRWWLTHDLDRHPVKNLAMMDGSRRADHATP
ncbi:MAG: hypothetical protein U1F43_19010 [Myxococcota bacterium]